MPKTPPRLYIFFGLIASGKSTLAAAWSTRQGALYLNSDRVRKELSGLDPTAPRRESFAAGIYTPEFSRRTYDALLAGAREALRQGREVALDGSYQSRAERERVLALARELAVDCRFILCRCPEALLKERMAERQRDPAAVSDGRWEIYLEQKERFEAADELAAQGLLIVIDTEAPVAALLDLLAERLAAARPAITPQTPKSLEEESNHHTPPVRSTTAMYNRMYLLRFPKETIDQPIICNLVKHYDIEFNILKADIFLQQDGVMVLELSGHKKNVQAGINYLKKLGVKVETLATVVSRDEESCFQCGACTGICAPGALAIKRPEMAVLFDPEKCSGCGLCVTVCPVRAMSISLDPESIVRA